MLAGLLVHEPDVAPRQRHGLAPRIDDRHGDSTGGVDDERINSHELLDVCRDREGIRFRIPHAAATVATHRSIVRRPGASDKRLAHGRVGEDDLAVRVRVLRADVDVVLVLPHAVEVDVPVRNSTPYRVHHHPGEGRGGCLRQSWQHSVQEFVVPAGLHRDDLSRLLAEEVRGLLVLAGEQDPVVARRQDQPVAAAGLVVAVLGVVVRPVGVDDLVTLFELAGDSAARHGLLGVLRLDHDRLDLDVRDRLTFLVEDQADHLGVLHLRVRLEDPRHAGVEAHATAAGAVMGEGAMASRLDLAECPRARAVAGRMLVGGVDVSEREVPDLAHLEAGLPVAVSAGQLSINGQPPLHLVPSVERDLDALDRSHLAGVPVLVTDRDVDRDERWWFLVGSEGWGCQGGQDQRQGGDQAREHRVEGASEHGSAFQERGDQTRESKGSASTPRLDAR
ncbi:hypothetical protein [uncultured Nocardioides sp.]|uniref:hypothetical protein n=1 Tax=uncultured Nocardioides sp. TaxID=198441 RepID=UPI00260E7A67|nr:hypothetical protein [uncultured Nocardioides sp.]